MSSSNALQLNMLTDFGDIYFKHTIKKDQSTYKEESQTRFKFYHLCQSYHQKPPPKLD